ncbi:hypothetical protein CBS101457_002757 [Exobasidium rhododendri]|nr:hypothetical protein CBS101457_002757 [Exobasidium rhododendri]
MPTITIYNDTQVPLHISLRHVSPLYYVNNVRPGTPAVFKNVGRVWFTIEARIARGGTDNNEYTMVESLAAPIGISLCVLSLGAGAVWVAGATTAAGGVTAAVTSISARIGATAAAQAPTARRLYKYAQKGQHIVQIGQVLGLGGGALLGKKAAEAQLGGPAQSELERKQKEKGGSSWFAWDENARVKEAKKVLKGLLEGSVVSSAGWYMKGERTIRIKGGPRATEMDGLLIIETDTLEAFVVVSDSENVEDGKAAFGDGTGEGSIKTWWSSLSQQAKGKNKEGKDEITDSQSSFSGLAALQDGTEPKEETSYERHQRQLYEKLSESSQWVYSRIRRGPTEPAPIEEIDDSDEKVDRLIPANPREGTQSPAPPPDDDPNRPPTLARILEEMGFNDDQIAQARAKVGELPTSHEQEEERKSKVEEAMLLLLSGDGSSEASKVATTSEATSEKEPDASTNVATMADDPSKPIPQVIGAEKVTTPHWTAKAKAAAESSGAIKILNLGGSHLMDRGEKWLQKK